MHRSLKGGRTPRNTSSSCKLLFWGLLALAWVAAVLYTERATKRQEAATTVHTLAVLDDEGLFPSIEIDGKEVISPELPVFTSGLPRKSSGLFPMKRVGVEDYWAKHTAETMNDEALEARCSNLSLEERLKREDCLLLWVHNLHQREIKQVVDPMSIIPPEKSISAKVSTSVSISTSTFKVILDDDSVAILKPCGLTLSRQPLLETFKEWHVRNRIMEIHANAILVANTTLCLPIAAVLVTRDQFTTSLQRSLVHPNDILQTVKKLFRFCGDDTQLSAVIVPWRPQCDYSWLNPTS